MKHFLKHFKKTPKAGPDNPKESEQSHIISPAEKISPALLLWQTYKEMICTKDLNLKQELVRNLLCQAADLAEGSFIKKSPASYINPDCEDSIFEAITVSSQQLKQKTAQLAMLNGLREIADHSEQISEPAQYGKMTVDKLHENVFNTLTPYFEKEGASFALSKEKFVNS